MRRSLCSPCYTAFLNSLRSSNSLPTGQFLRSLGERSGAMVVASGDAAARYAPQPAAVACTYNSVACRSSYAACRHLSQHSQLGAQQDCSGRGAALPR